MFHPDTELRQVSPLIGYGVFATRPIPVGTLTYVRDELELAVPPDSPLLQNPLYAPLIEKYAYVDPDGRHIVSWDIGKYVNHSCRCNSMSTGYGFEIAIRDIEAGEQITDDYGLFNMTEPFTCACGEDNCRGQILGSDLATYRAAYDRTAKLALARSRQVDQPLGGYLSDTVREALEGYFNGDAAMWSVRRLIASPDPTSL